MYLFVGNCVILVLRPTPPSFIKGAPGCGSQRLLRYRSHPAGRGPNSSSLFPPLAAVVAVAHYICKWLNRFDKDRKPD